MQRPKIPPTQEIIDTAERVLAETFGGAVRVDEGEDLQGGMRALVYRFKILDGPGSAPASVIVKQVKSTEKERYEPDRQRYLQRSDIVVKTTEAAGHMQALGVTIRAMARKMRTLWSDVEEMPYYPAFR